MQLYAKVKSLYKFLIGCPFGTFIIFSNLFSSKKIKLVKLFSSKFGHFLVNTEIFLREEYSKNYKFIFFTEDVIDNDDLLKLWKKKIFIISSNSGFFLYKCLFFLGWQFYDLREYTFPRKMDVYRKKNFLFKKKKLNFKFNYFTSSIRTFNYNKHTQTLDKIDPDPYQSWRDTNLNNFFSAISKTTNKNKKTFIINKLFDSSFLNNKKNLIFYKKNYDLNKVFNLTLGSKFHLASCTGIDSISYLQNIPTAYINGTLGLGFHSVSFSDKAIFCPLNIYSFKKKQILSLKEQIDLLRHLQKKFNIDRFEAKHQKYYDIKYVQQSYDEILNIIIEIDKLSSGKNIMTKFDESLQNKFWNIYPNKWFTVSKTCVFNKQFNKTILSPYFLRKHRKLYLN